MTEPWTAFGAGCFLGWGAGVGSVVALLFVLGGVRRKNPVVGAVDRAPPPPANPLNPGTRTMFDD